MKRTHALLEAIPLLTSSSCRGLIPTELPALFRDGTSGPSHECTIRAMRLGVMLIEGRCDAAVGDRLFIRFYVPTSERVFELPVFVRWRCSGHFGVQMGSVGVRATIAITHFLGKLPAREGERLSA